MLGLRQLQGQRQEYCAFSLPSTAVPDHTLDAVKVAWCQLTCMAGTARHSSRTQAEISKTLPPPTVPPYGPLSHAGAPAHATRAGRPTDHGPRLTGGTTTAGTASPRRGRQDSKLHPPPTRSAGVEELLAGAWGREPAPRGAGAAPAGRPCPARPPRRARGAFLPGELGSRPSTAPGAPLRASERVAWARPEHRAIRRGPPKRRGWTRPAAPYGGLGPAWRAATARTLTESTESAVRSGTK